MATYYVSYARGSDANTTVQAQSPSTPWKTLAQAIGTGLTAGPAAAGDTVVVEPGIQRETATVKHFASGTAGNPITIVGDVDGSRFRAGGLASPLTGMVQITPHATDATQAPAIPVFSLNNFDFLTYQNLFIIGGRATGSACILANAAVSKNVTLTNCAFIATVGNCIQSLAQADNALNWTVDRCWFAGYNGCIEFDVPYSATAEYNLNVNITNCLFLCINVVAFNLKTTGTASTFLPYGVTIQGCTFLEEIAVECYTGLTLAVTGTPVTVKNCNIAFCLWAFQAGTGNVSGSRYIVEDYNVVTVGSGSYSTGSVSVGAHSVGSTIQQYAPLMHFGQELLWGGRVRPFGMPTAGSPLLNFGDGTAPAYDITGRNRPEGS